MSILAENSEASRTGSSHKANHLVSLCKAAADPLRLDIMRVLCNDSFGVQELAAIFSMPQPGMSHHLKILAKSGLLVSRRQGNSIFYRLALLRAEGECYEFTTHLFATIASLALADPYLKKIQNIYRDRSAQSRLYFDRHVDKFEENQGMLCELSQYLPNIRELLDLIALPRASRCMEVGPGQGELLKELTKRYDQLVGLDSSEEMLALTKTKLTNRDRIHFVQSSLEDFVAPIASFDLVVLNMVLHHMPSPRLALQKLRHLLRRDGFLLLADLCSHDQAWTQTSCGDVWLGFDPQDLKEWGLSSDFAIEQSLYLGLKNGFQIQLRLFRAIV